MTLGHCTPGAKTLDKLKSITNIAPEFQAELEHGERTSFRFPIRLPIRIALDGTDYTAESENFSSSGALLRLESPIPAGSKIHFLVEIPSEFTGSDTTAAIDGEGVVVRSYQENDKHYAAIVINEYRFQ